MVVARYSNKKLGVLYALEMKLEKGACILHHRSQALTSLA